MGVIGLSFEYPCRNPPVGLISYLPKTLPNRVLDMAFLPERIYLPLPTTRRLGHFVRTRLERPHGCGR